MKAFDIKNGVLISFDEKATSLNNFRLVEFVNSANGKTKTESVVILPYNVKIVGKSSFAKKLNINRIEFNRGLYRIDDNAFYYCEDLQSVNFPSSLTEIGQYAFYGCHLKEIMGGKKLKVIESNAFAENHFLEVCRLSSGVEKIGNYAFFACEDLEEINLPKTIKEIGMSAFANTNLSSVELPNITRIESGTFANSKLSEVIIPSGVTFIGDSAFSKTHLKEVDLPLGLKTIEWSAFKDCAQLEEVIIPNTVSSLGRGAFAGCTNLNYVLLPNSLHEIQAKTFQGCKMLSNINLPYTLTKIGESAFEETGLNEIVLHDNVREIGKNAFLKCERLHKVQMSDKIQKIGDNAFEDCDGLESLRLPNDLVKLGKGALKNCSYLRFITLPPKITEIPDELCQYCDELVEVKLPRNLTKIGELAFSSCLKLEEISLPKGVESIGKEAFAYCEKLRSIAVPDSVTFLGENAFKGCKNLEKVVLPSNLSVIIDGLFSGCQNLKKITLPESVKLIGINAFSDTAIESIDLSNVDSVVETSAFSNCKELKNIVLPPNMIVVKDASFDGCVSLESINLPKNITRIEAAAFRKCEKLTSLILPEKLKSIEKEVFKDCYALSSIKLPQSLESIGDEAFMGCSTLEKLVLPSGVKNIGKDAFKGCQNLKEITINGGTLDECLFNLGESIELIKISEDCICNAKRLYPMQYITKKGKYFYLSELPLDEESFPLKDFDEKLSLGILVNQWDKRKILQKEVKGKNNENVIGLYNYLFSALEKDKFSEFMENKELKFFNQFCKNHRINSTNFYKLFYNLGGFRKPEIETRINKRGEEAKKLVDYGQIVSTFLEEALFKDRFFNNNLNYISKPMKLQGFKREFTKFITNRENLTEIIKDTKIEHDFFAKCYNYFEDVQKTNIAQKGAHRQLKPTVQKFRDYFRKNKFEGITEEFAYIADAIAPYYVAQNYYDDAVAIEKERQALGTPTRILKEHLKEEDVFGKIDDYSEKIRALHAEAMSSLATVAEENFSFEWLEKNDPNNFLLGEFTSSCAHLSGVGYGIMRASIIHKDIQNLVVRNNQGDIVAKATLYLNRKQGYGVINTFEAKMDLNKEEKQIVYQKLKLGISAFAERYNAENPKSPLKLINVGINLNRFEEEIKAQEKQSSTLLESINFQEYGKSNGDYNGDSIYGQYTIWEDEEEL